MDAMVGGVTLHYELRGARGSLVVLTHGLGGTLDFCVLARNGAFHRRDIQRRRRYQRGA